MPRARQFHTVLTLVRRALPVVACTLALSVGRPAQLHAQDTTKTAPPAPAAGATPAPQDSVKAPHDSLKGPADSVKAPRDTTKHAVADSVKKLAAVPSPTSAAGDSAHVAATAPAGSAASTEPTVTPAGAPAGVAASATAPAVTAPAITGPAVTAPAVTAPAGTAPVTTTPVPTAAAATAPAATAPAASAPASTAAVTDPHLNVPMPVVTAPPPVDTLPDANQHVQAASRMLEQGKVGAAIGELLQGVREDPTDIDTWVSLGDIYRQTGKTKLALETYSKALNVVSGAADALRVPYAELLFRNKKKDQAIEVLKKGIELDPEVSADMKSLLGRIIIDDLTVGETNDEVASDLAEPSTTEKAPAEKTTTAAKKKPSAPKISVKKKKRLCKLFCPEDLKVPKK